jgi:aldehyde:ferredoxin oxidoreductase
MGFRTGVVDMPDQKQSADARGFCGRICFVDLSTGQIEFEDLGEDVYRKYLSGVGIGAKVLWDRMGPGADPLGPDNILGFTTGLLTDTGSLFTGRFTVVAKSPASGGWGDANCGGYFSPILKRCGVDALFFRGISAGPVYLYMDDKSSEIRDASDLWGKDTVETEDELKARYGNAAQVACIGPAGEGCSYVACISTDRGRMAARSGMGAVMGSKKLKAVVVAGKKKVPVADKARIRELSARFRSKIKDPSFVPGLFNDWMTALLGKILGRIHIPQLSTTWRMLLRGYGTPGLTAMCAESGDSPIRNWGGAVRPDYPSKLYRKVGMRPVIAYETKKYGCYSCPVRCGGHVSVTDGPYKIERMHKPEYETICAFGAMLLNDDLHSIFKINDLVNRGGIDSISCGSIVAFAVECYENGVLTKEDTSGLELTWGNSDAIIELTRMIIEREGIGDALADGVKVAAEKIGKGAEKYAVHCGGIEPPMHHPMFDTGWAFTYYLESTPGRHTTSCNQYLEMQHLKKKYARARGKPRREDMINEHAKHAYRINVGADYKMLVDAVGACLFGTHVGGPLPLGDWINAATGWNYSYDDYLAVGERIRLLRHAFNVREGINPIRDCMPHARLFGDPPMMYGPLKGKSLDLNAMAQAYYKMAGWDVDTGRPDRKRLQEAALEEVIQELYPERETQGHQAGESR